MGFVKKISVAVSIVYHEVLTVYCIKTKGKTDILNRYVTETQTDER